MRDYDNDRNHRRLKITSYNKHVREKLLSTNIDRNRRRRNNSNFFEKFLQTDFLDRFFRCDKRADFVATTNFAADRIIVDFDINY